VGELRVLVTGGAGFIGSHVVDELLTREHEVAVLDNLSTGSPANLRPGVHFYKSDITMDLADVMAACHPEVVVHMAAQVSVPKSVADPLRDLAVNVGGTSNVVMTAAKAKVRKVVVISSAAVYGIPRSLPVTEESEQEVVSPYGLSKLSAERYVRLLGNMAGIAYTILRPANIYGPHQTTEGEGAVVPAFLARFLSGRDPVIHGDGSQTRDFLFVSDMARAIAASVEKGDGQTLNVSSGMPVTVNELWTKLATLVGWRKPPQYGPARQGDIPHSVMANATARRHLSWEPKVGLDAGLASTVLWAKRDLVATAKF
jgi:UDP-glucose 4-epimerase